MLKIFAGLKGSGKTKNLIDLANAAADSAHGSVVFIARGTNLIHEISNKARLIDPEVYGIDDAEKLYGFICGVLASNYDISDIFIDSALRICRDDQKGFEELLCKTEKQLEENHINLTVSASIEADELPQSLKAYLA